MPNGLAKMLDSFVPASYYEFWAREWSVSLDAYPYIFQEYDPALRRTVPFAVYNFYMNEVDGYKVASAVVVYKSLYSKSSFRRLIYL